MNRFFVAIAGLYGALGVVLAAASAHGADAAALDPASQMLLFHAPALLALGLYAGASRPLRWGGAILALGAGLFAAALAGRYYLGAPPFPMAAPAGGTLMILGWAVVLFAGLVLRKA